MDRNTVFLLLLMTVITSAVIEEKLANSVLKCQFGKSFRKQIDVWPLSGMCMRDMVIHLSKNLRSFSIEELGITEFQQQLDKLVFVNSLDGPKTKLDSTIDKLNDKIKTYTNILRDSKDIIQPLLLKQNELTYSSQKHEPSNQPSDLCTKINAAFSMNFGNQDWKNLHILPVGQPQTMCGLPSSGLNIGPLLLSQCSRTKQVLLLLEHNSMMLDNEISLAKIYAKTIIHMLSETDSVSVIGLADVNGLMQCHNQSLPKATDIQKLRLDRYIDSLERSNSTFRQDVRAYIKDLNGEVIIIHLTNTIDNLSEIQNLAAAVTSAKLSIHLGTVFILPDNFQESDRYDSNSFKDENIIIVLPSRNSQEYEIAKIYEIAKLFTGIKCNKEDLKQYYLSNPYFEPYRKTMMLSIGHITNTAVLSYDIELQEFVEDLTYFNAGEHVHAMLMDKRGVLWMHKTFQRMETVDEQPLKVYFQDLENINDTEVANAGIMSKREGNIQVTTISKTKKHLMWKHLDYDELLVCLVIEKIEESLPVVKNPPKLPSNILHYRLDLILQTSIGRDTLCSYSDNRLGSLEAGVVYFSPWCFQTPSEQARQLDNAPAVTMQSYMAYIKDVTRLLVNPGLQPSVKSDVATLARILNHFKTRHMESSFSKYVVQRYVTSVISGVLEIYPGTTLDSELDPKRRIWYSKAMANPGKIVLTPPYLDATGAGYVVTISHTAYEGRPAALHSIKDPIVGVLSMDLTIGYIAKILSEMFPLCSEARVKCFLMDEAGYLIYHPRLLEPGARVESYHLMNEEFLVANDILNHEFFVRKTACASHMDGTSQRSYQFNTSLDEVLTNVLHGEHSVMYQIGAVPGTNVFLGVVNVTSNSSAFCPCSTKNRLCLNCHKMEQQDCECPCECSMFSNDCSQRSFEPEDSVVEICPAVPEKISSQPAARVRLGILTSCQSYRCRSFDSKAECLGVVGCQWCERDTDGETNLEAPYCSDIALCFGGVFMSVMPYDGIDNLPFGEEMVGQEWPAVGPVAGGILAIVIILGVSLFCYKLRNVQGLEHQCLHMQNSPDTLRMTNLDGDIEPNEFERHAKSTMDSALLRDVLAPISPYRVFSNYRRPAGGDSDHGYSTMTPHEDSEQQTFVEPLLVLTGDMNQEKGPKPSTSKADAGSKENVIPPITHVESSPHRVLVPVTVHRNMDTHYC